MFGIRHRCAVIADHDAVCTSRTARQVAAESPLASVNRCLILSDREQCILSFCRPIFNAFNFYYHLANEVDYAYT